MNPASAPAARLKGFVRAAEAHQNYSPQVARLLFTAVSRVVASMAAPRATVADVEAWLNGPGTKPSSFTSKHEISAATHATYVSRARKVISDYFRCGGDVAAWPAVAMPSPSRSKSIELPLSNGRAAELSFPSDLSQAEARAIAAQLEALKAVFLARAEMETDG